MLIWQFADACMFTVPSLWQGQITFVDSLTKVQGLTLHRYKNFDGKRQVLQ